MVGSTRTGPDQRPTRARRGRLALVLAVVGSLCLAAPCPSPALAAESRDEEPVARTVLALYDGAREPDPADTRVHRYAEAVLNHLGFVVAYHDIREPLPDPETVRTYAGLLTWFAAPPAARGRYLAWAETAVRSARKLIVLGATGGEFWSADMRGIQAILGEIGLTHDRRAIEATLGTRVVAEQRGLTRFERAPDPVVPGYDVVHATVRAEADVWLELGVPDRAGGGASVAVAVTRRGGYAAAGFELAEDRGLDRARWLIDPFAFFGRILSADPWPVPDVTTVSGRRLYFSHVEGDGLNDVVGERQSRMLVAQRFLSDIVEAYPDLPLTFGLTPGDLDPRLGGNETPRALVAQIWGAAQVEPAVASYTRPFDWPFFARYSREREIARAAAARHDLPAGILRTEDPDPAVQARWSVSRGREFPRQYLARPFDLGTEIDTAADTARALLPVGKTLRLYLWTGNAKPFEAAVAATRRRHLLNMNGGESRFDADYASVAHLAPLARPVGAERQIYAGAADEIPVEKAWRPIRTGLRGFAATLANTGWPRRLKGYNLHYHLASLADPEALRIVRGYLDEARTAALVPIAASTYAAMVEGFFEAAVTRFDSGRWRVARRGAVQTLRLDGAGERRVDLGRSRGVMGQTRYADALYLTLDPAVEPVEIVLASGPAAAAAPVSLVESRWQLAHLQRDEHGWRFEARGFGAGTFRWENVAAGRYDVTAHRAGEMGGETVWRGAAEAEGGGLAFTIPDAAGTPLDVEVARPRIEARND